MYKIIYSPKAIEDLQKLKRSEPAAYKKADKFIKELKEHPKTGTGHPEPLKGDRNGQWSRTITKKHRLIYEIFETEVYVDEVALLSSLPPQTIIPSLSPSPARGMFRFGDMVSDVSFQ